MVNGRNDVTVGLLPPPGSPAVEWRMEDGRLGYEAAVAAMEARAAAVAEGRARELVWLIEHPPLYTAGTSAKPEELIAARSPMVATASS